MSKGTGFGRCQSPLFRVVLPTNTSVGSDAAGFSLYRPYGADWCSIIRTTTMASCQNGGREHSRENKYDHMLFHRYLVFRKRATQAAPGLSSMRGNIPSFS